MLKELDSLLHSELRLAIMSILIGVAEVDFTYLKEKTGATSGNLSVQLDKLQKANYIDVKKEFAGKRPRTTCSVTQLGRVAFEKYVENIKSYLHI
ncbi:MAG: winged helix-turn-helix domain-containing protein [Bacteroidales bacterium]